MCTLSSNEILALAFRRAHVPPWSEPKVNHAIRHGGQALKYFCVPDGWPHGKVKLPALSDVQLLEPYFCRRPKAYTLPPVAPT